MKLRSLAALMLLLIPASLRADPITIVDTGPGPSTLPGFELSSLQWVAVEFPVNRPAIITAAQGWMIVSSGGFLDLALYRGGGDVPGDMLFRSTGHIDSGNADWRGLSMLAWPVTPGNYWLGFEPSEVNAMAGALPFPSERPLRNGAVVDREFNTRTYQEADAVAQMGLRIFGDAAPAPTPEPATILLAATGLAALMSRRRAIATKSSVYEPAA
jgi:PEP-CTERM motif